MLKCMKTLTNQTLLQNIQNKILIEPYNDGKVNHIEKNMMVSLPCPLKAKVVISFLNTTYKIFLQICM